MIRRQRKSVVGGKAQRRSVKEEDEAPRMEDALGRGNNRVPKRRASLAKSQQEGQSGEWAGQRREDDIRDKTGDRSHKNHRGQWGALRWGALMQRGSHCELWRPGTAWWFGQGCNVSWLSLYQGHCAPGRESGGAGVEAGGFQRRPCTRDTVIAASTW